MNISLTRKLLTLVICGAFAGISCSPGHPGATTPPSSGGTPPPTGSNVQAITVNAGATNNFVNGAFTSVIVCVPNTTNCQTIDNVLVDTGSFGLRLLSSASGGAFTLTLPGEQDASGNTIAECTKFVDLSFLWGPVRVADVKLAGETASSVPVNVVGEAAFATVPANCSSGGTNDNSLAALAANGILGVGPFQEDCGTFCSTGTTPPAQDPYYSCPTATTCQQAFVSVAKQVQNPIPFFATDNNGVILQFPTVPAAGSGTLTGSMIFGIGTQSNNGLGSAKIFPIDPSGNFTTVFNSQTVTNSFIDSGSNGIFFLDAATTGIAICPSGSNAPGFYCPTSTQNLTATQKGFGGTPTGTVSFQIANANNLLNANPTATAFVNLGGPGSGMFDWGLPFFYGRSVFTAIQGKTTPGGAGPYWAY